MIRTTDPRTLTAEQRHELRTSYSGASFAMDYGPCAVYVRDTGRGLSAYGFIGTATKAAWAYSFGSMRTLGEYADKWAQGVAATVAAKAERAAERASFRHTLVVGDVLVSVWGYDQTNVDYYQVTALIGSTMVEVREIASQSESSGDMTGESVPAPGNFIGKPIRARAQQGNRVRVRSCATAWPAEFCEVGGVRIYKARRWTAYA